MEESTLTKSAIATILLICLVVLLNSQNTVPDSLIEPKINQNFSVGQIEPKVITEVIADSRQTFEIKTPSRKPRITTITYKIDKSCSTDMKNNVLLSMDVIQKQTNGIISYQLIEEREFHLTDDPKLNIDCYDNGLDSSDFDVATTITAGLSTIWKYENEKIPTKCEIDLYEDGESYEVELHELIHCLGISEHSSDPNSVMYRYTNGANNIDVDTLNKIKEIYA